MSNFTDRLKAAIFSSDKWTGKDKVKHVVAGFVIGFSVTLMSDNETYGFSAGVAAAFGKEVYDFVTPGHMASSKDFLVTCAATALGCAIARNFTTNKQVIMGLIT